MDESRKLLRANIRKANIAKAKTRHGHSANGKLSPTYNSWIAMKRRCSDSTRKNYEEYGGRGITYCERWKSFDNFLTDMGERPEGMTLDRKDTNGNYEPGNCRWATASQQIRNRRSWK
jgi:hypothetical protein